MSLTNLSHLIRSKLPPCLSWSRQWANFRLGKRNFCLPPKSGHFFVWDKKKIVSRYRYVSVLTLTEIFSFAFFFLTQMRREFVETQLWSEQVIPRWNAIPNWNVNPYGNANSRGKIRPLLKNQATFLFGLKKDRQSLQICVSPYYESDFLCRLLLSHTNETRIRWNAIIRANNR